MQTCEDAVGTCFAAERFTDNHESMTNDHHLVNLLDLLEEEGSALKVHLLTVMYHVLVEDFVVGRRKRHAREQITRDTYQQKPPLVECNKRLLHVQEG